MSSGVSIVDDVVYKEKKGAGQKSREKLQNKILVLTLTRLLCKVYFLITWHFYKNNAMYSNIIHFQKYTLL